MPEQNINNQNQQTTNDPFQRLDFLFSQLPDHVNDWLFSEKITSNVKSLAQRFYLSDEKIKSLAEITGRAILRDITLESVMPELKKALQVDELTAKKLAVETATLQFLVIRDYLQGVENFIRQLGGALPAALPATLTANTPTQTPIIQTAPARPPILKSLRQAVQDNKEVLNQQLTNTPIKIADFDQPVRPTVKNWLADYVKQKGAGYHEQLERGDYLFNSANAKLLQQSERRLVAELLKSYDDDSNLPIDTDTKLILIEKLGQPSPNTPQTQNTPLATPSPPPITPPPAKTAPLPGAASYREPIAREDLTNRFAPPEIKPPAKITGNIIDLS